MHPHFLALECQLIVTCSRSPSSTLYQLECLWFEYQLDFIVIYLSFSWLFSMILEKNFPSLSLSPSLIPLPTSQLLSSLLLIHHPLPPAFSLFSSLIHAVMQVNGLNLHYQSCCSLPQFHPPSLEMSPFRAWILDPHLQESAGSLLHP